MSSSSSYAWYPSSSVRDIDCLCLGTGRFLRSVLVPALVGAGLHPALIQTRGRSMLEYMQNSDEGVYEIDTVTPSGDVETTRIPIYGAFTLGSAEGKHHVLQELIPSIATAKKLSVLGVGVTEAGLSSSATQVMKDLYEILQCIQKNQSTDNQKLCIIDMDNIPNNGQVIRKHMMELASSSDEGTMTTFLQTKVVFMNTMVDRITSQRDGDPMIPKCEPVPKKALVVLDSDNDLPTSLTTLDPNQYGVVIRTTSAQLQGDIALKLRVANGTHTAIAHVLALSKLLKTDILAHASEGALWMTYLDALFVQDILEGAKTAYGQEETLAAYEDWRRRLTHAHFGLSTFFITQNGAAKGGIRLGPTLVSLLQQDKPVSVSMAFAFAALLRWLTPVSATPAASNGIYRGWLNQSDRIAASESLAKGEMYADGLSYSLNEGWYEFKCACSVSKPGTDDSTPVSEWLGELAATPQQPQAYVNAIRAYLRAGDGGNLRSVASLAAFEDFVRAVATLYARMVAGDGMVQLLDEMNTDNSIYENGLKTDSQVLTDSESLQNGQPLMFRPSCIPDSSQLMQYKVTNETIASTVTAEVASVMAIDLHTHLLPPSHGALCCWGIDELLTYHYLVAEYFMTAPASMTPEAFYILNKKEQADTIWKALFIDRSPVSEACRGVITTLRALGLDDAVDMRDLDAVRDYYSSFRDRGWEGAEDFSKLVYRKAGVRYAVMTNIPFSAAEASQWRPKPKEYPEQYRSALRVDPLLSGDRATVASALRSSGYDVTLEGARQYLRDWCDTMKPEYMMASTPHNFLLPEGRFTGVAKTGINEEAMKQPFAFADAIAANNECIVNCNGEDDAAASVIDENSDLLSQVLMPVCEERDLPVALKIGAHRGVNPRLKTAGDGVVAFADAGVLARLCSRFSKVRFLATFLSRNNQHEACIVASKFSNLHIYGCWWFCNNPSIIREITQMRMEMLGTAFTAQHSDARVLDQLIYKWSHSRAVIASVLAEEYTKLAASGWSFTRAELRRDVKRLFGGSYEEFMEKSFAGER